VTDLDELWRGSSAERLAALPGPLRALHRTVLRRFLETGSAPTARWIREAAAEHGLGDSAIAGLAAADLVHVADGVVSVAYPFSGGPTRQQVELDGYPAVYSMCAIDALGMPAMAGRDGRITAIDPHDGAPVVVSVRDGSWTWTPAGAVVVRGRTADCGTDCQSWDVACPNITFHASRDSARAYLDSRGDISGEILDQQAAIDLGQRIFGPMLGRMTTGTGPAPRFAGTFVEVPGGRLWAEQAGSGPEDFVRIARLLADRIPGARLLIMPGADHNVPVRAGSAFTELLAGFLGGLLPPARLAPGRRS